MAYWWQPADHVVLLNQLMQDRCRSNVSVRYVETGVRRMKVLIGTREFHGSPAFSWWSAKQNAARRAHEELSGLTEQQIRQTCGLPGRPRVDEVDEMRDVLRRLRKRANDELHGGARYAARNRIGHAYMAIDSLEQQLLNMGL